MKKLIIYIIIGLLYNSPVFSQEKGGKYFKKGNEQFGKKQYLKALLTYQALIELEGLPSEQIKEAEAKIQECEKKIQDAFVELKNKTDKLVLKNQAISKLEEYIYIQADSLRVHRAKEGMKMVAECEGNSRGSLKGLLPEKYKIRLVSYREPSFFTRFKVEIEAMGYQVTHKIKEKRKTKEKVTIFYIENIDSKSKANCILENIKNIRISGDGLDDAQIEKG